MIVDKLYFSPVKSLSLLNTNNFFVKRNIGIKNDRIFAFTRLISKKESIVYEKYPKKRNLKFFLTLKNSTFLNKYNFKFNNRELSLLLNNKLIKKITIHNNDNFESLSKELEHREKLITTTPYLIYNESFPFFDTMPNNSISLINLNSIKDFEEKVERKIEHERFRGNIYVNNIEPWAEFSWINKEIAIGDCLFKVIRKIPRCSATNLKPNSDVTDINLPQKLIDNYGQRNMGIYLMPLNDGYINVGNKIKF